MNMGAGYPQQFEQDSPAVALLRHVWRYGKRGSCRRLNESMQSALQLAIKCGMLFDPQDFKALEKMFRFRYWGGASNARGLCGEYFYSRACGKNKYGSDVAPNRSAAIAFEVWAGRPPYIYKAADFYDMKLKPGRRLAEGVDFQWWENRNITTEPLRLRLTSFVKDGLSIIACHFAHQGGLPRTKLTRRLTITHAELQQHNRWVAAEMKALKERLRADAKALAEVRMLANGGSNHG